MPVGLGDLPIWVFHGDKDRSIDVSPSERVVESLKQSEANDLE